MLGRVVNHVAALAERRQIARTIVGRIVVEVRAGDIDPRNSHAHSDVRADYADAPSPSVAPLPAIGIPPAPVTEMKDTGPMGRWQCSHRPLARPKRISFDSSDQSIGYSQRCSGIIGMTGF
jgi:hypothetical protein